MMVIVQRGHVVVVLKRRRVVADLVDLDGVLGVQVVGQGTAELVPVSRTYAVLDATARREVAGDVGTDYLTVAQVTAGLTAPAGEPLARVSAHVGTHFAIRVFW